MGSELISLYSSAHFAMFVRIICTYFKLKHRDNITDPTENGIARIMGVLLLQKPLRESVKPCLEFLYRNHPQSTGGILSLGCCKSLLLGSVDAHLSGSQKDGLFSVSKVMPQILSTY